MFHSTSIFTPGSKPPLPVFTCRYKNTDTYSYSLINMATEANRQDVLPFSLCVFQLSSWVICQPIFCPLLLLAVGQLKGGNGGLTEACHFMHFHLRDSEWERNGQACQTQQSLLIKCMSITLPVLITVKSSGSMQFECFLHHNNFLLTFQTITQCSGIFAKLIIILLSRDKTAATENTHSQMSHRCVMFVNSYFCVISVFFTTLVN